VPRARTERPPGRGDELARRGVRNRTSVYSRYSRRVYRVQRRHFGRVSYIGLIVAKPKHRETHQRPPVVSASLHPEPPEIRSRLMKKPFLVCRMPDRPPKLECVDFPITPCLFRRVQSVGGFLPRSGSTPLRKESTVSQDGKRVRGMESDHVRMRRQRQS
jgi:hypothetical protein